MYLDLLGDALAALTFKELNLVDFQLGAPWAISTEGFAPSFNLIVGAGRCEVRLPDGSDVQLTEGQSILMPRGGWITYASSLNVPAAKLTEVWDEDEFRELGDYPAKFEQKIWGGDGEVCRLLGFAFELSETAEEQLLPSLPDAIILTNSQATIQMAKALRRYLNQAEHIEPGEFATRARFAEGLVIEQIRQHILSTDYQTGWIAGLRHPKLHQALALIHTQYAERWTIEALARACGMSRASFAKQFHDVLGQPPMEYLNNWRVGRAKTLMTEGDLPMSAIAYRVGFASEIAFRRNVQRALGRTPRDIRSAARI